jgi:uncharacterized membrane protein
VWSKRGWDGSRRSQAATRWLVGIGGGALAIQALRKRSFAGSVLAGVGGSLAWWALTGSGDLPDAGQWMSRMVDRWRHDDLVHEASADSFPASDAPSFTPTVGTKVNPRRQGR